MFCINNKKLIKKFYNITYIDFFDNNILKLLKLKNKHKKMTVGIIYFAKNYTGYKLGFTKINVKYAIENLNISQIGENFEFVCGGIAKNPKSVKDKLKNKIKENLIQKDLYNFINDKVPYNLLKSNYNIVVIDKLNLLDDIYLNNSESDSDIEQSYDNLYNNKFINKDNKFIDKDDKFIDEEDNTDNSDYTIEKENLIEKILFHYGDINNLKDIKFYVKWIDYPLEKSTWEPIKNLIHNEHFIEYIESKKEELYKIKEIIDILF